MLYYHLDKQKKKIGSKVADKMALLEHLHIQEMEYSFQSSVENDINNQAKCTIYNPSNSDKSSNEKDTCFLANDFILKSECSVKTDSEECTNTQLDNLNKKYIENNQANDSIKRSKIKI